MHRNVQNKVHHEVVVLSNSYSRQYVQRNLSESSTEVIRWYARPKTVAEFTRKWKKSTLLSVLLTINKVPLVVST